MDQDSPNLSPPPEDGGADQLEALEALAGIMDAMSAPGRELNRPLHEQHVELARRSGMDDQLAVAKGMMVGSLACGDDVWLPYLEEKTAKADVTSAGDLEEVLRLHEQSVQDYLSIPLLSSRIDFVLRHWSRIQEGKEDEDLKEMLEEVEALFTEDVVRDALRDSAGRASAHLAESHLIWDKVKDWELSLLDGLTAAERTDRLPSIHKLFLDRLRAPHSTAGTTFQSYNSFISKYDEDAYESRMVVATKAKADGLNVYSKRERWEDQLVAPGAHPPSIYPSYIAWELKPKKPDGHLVQALYARAIADVVSRGPYDAEPFWISFISYLQSNVKIESIVLQQLVKAVRSVPGSGEIWAAYIRSLESFEKELPQIEAIYRTALGTDLLLTRGADDLVKVVIARLSCERRRTVSGEASEGSFANLALEGIEMVTSGIKGGDPSFRIEKYLISWYEGLQQPNEASAIWESLTKSHPSSYLVWTGWATFETSTRFAVPKARTIYTTALGRAASLDWPEAVFDAYLTFEEHHGTLDTLLSAREKVDKAQGLVDAKRHKEAAKAAKVGGYDQAGAAAYQARPSAVGADGMGMDVDGAVGDQAEENGKKRKAEDEVSGEDAKKSRPDEPVAPTKPVNLIRDRENSTIFVSKLVLGTTEEALRALFKDCGEIREVKFKELEDQFVGTVEFMSRDSVLGALTKDKKKINDVEIEVSLAWQSTLYIANFPEKSNDAFIRELFGAFGPIFDTRWPGKKVKGSRRFVYLQYLSPSSAQAALSLNGRELEPTHPLSVAISNPERKKERTDAKVSDREIVITQMSKFVNKKDLEKLFSPFGKIKDIRMTLDKDNHTVGAAFVEYEDASSVKEALTMNSHEIKKRRIAVTIPDSRGGGVKKIAMDQSIRIGQLPSGTQEALLQQALEPLMTVLRVSITEKFNEAVVELDSADSVATFISNQASNPFTFNGQALPIIPATQRFPPPAAAPTASTSAVFTESTPAAATTSEQLFRPPPRPQTGRRKGPAVAFSGKGKGAGAGGGDVEMQESGEKPKPKGQDAFRAMLSEKK